MKKSQKSRGLWMRGSRIGREDFDDRMKQDGRIGEGKKEGGMR